MTWSVLLDIARQSINFLGFIVFHLYIFLLDENVRPLVYYQSFHVGNQNKWSFHRKLNPNVTRIVICFVLFASFRVVTVVLHFSLFVPLTENTTPDGQRQPNRSQFYFSKLSCYALRTDLFLRGSGWFVASRMCWVTIWTPNQSHSNYRCFY